MRKLSLLTALFLMFSFMGFAQEWHGITSDSPTKMKKTLVSSTANEIVVNVNLDGFYTQSVTTPNGKQVVVSVDKMATELEAGAPQLPYEVIPVMIGDLAEMTVNVTNAAYVDFENVEVAPSKGNFSRQINPEDVPYTYGEMYSQNAFWPATQATLEAPYIIRDFRGQNIWVRPFAYNPVTKTLRVYTSMTVVMTKVSDNGENQMSARKATTKVAPEFKAAYERRFINFDQAAKDYPFVEDAGEMLVICADQFMTSMQPLVDWKNISGRPTTMVSVTAAGGNSDTQIKSYITNMYNDPNHNLAYVLFVGDYEHITPHLLSQERSDNWFGQISGSDHYPEVLIGRFSVQTDAHVTSQVNKVLYYERDLQGGVNWVDKGMGIGYYGAGSGHYGEDDYQHIDLIRDTLLHYTYSTVTEHHGGSGGDASVSTISGTTNQGISIINYCNHGSETSWGVANYSTSNVNALTNDNMWPVVWSVACLNGKFNHGGANGECFGEAWMRATNNSTGVPTGAIGGMFSWMSQPWVPPMYGQDEMVDILCGWRSADQFNHTLGGASINGDMAVIDKSGSSGYDCHDTWVLFGDPTTMLRTANPTDMAVTASPSVLMLGMDALTVNANADYAIATLSMNGEVIATGNVVNGQCELTFPALSNVGMADLVVLGYNKVTYVGQIEVVPAAGPYVTINDYAMSGPANYGETVDMSVEVKNVGVETTTNVAVTLSTESEYLTITSAEGTVATLAAGATATVEGFQFAVAENVPDGATAQIDVTMTSGANTWTGKIMVSLHAPVVVLESMNVNASAVEFSFKNNGSAPFVGGQLTMTSCSPDLVFDPEVLVAEDVVEAGQSLPLTVAYTVDSSIEPGTTFEAAYSFTTGLFDLSSVFVVSYGAIMEDFETGSFGTNWTLSSTNPWQIVSGGRGSYCAKSNNGGQHNSSGYMELSVNVLAAGQFSFWYKVSSENNYDKLHFYMDGLEKGTWSGTVAWTEFTQAVTAGQHTLKWEYTKDSSVSSGEDCAWVDDIIFPPTHVYTFIAPATDLEATVDGGNVNLTWAASADAVSYVVKRDLEEIGTPTETSFTDVVEEGGYYKYSVYAVDANGSMSAPVSTVVLVEFTGVEENEVRFGIYPNPAENELNINSSAASFEYQMINSVGQVVMSGVANGNVKLNVSELKNGVYFLKVVANGNTSVEKVVIK